jgi:hypothetical protein
MEEVELYARVGELVAKKEIPCFRTMPDVLIWGSRVFTKIGHDEHKYVEAFAFWIVDKEGPEDIDDWSA